MQIVIAVGREPADPRARRKQQPQFRTHKFASAHDQDGTGLQIEEYRQKSHPLLSSPALGLTGIIFYICLVQRPQRENYFFSTAVQL
jgi:hypothetical protein